MAHWHMVFAPNTLSNMLAADTGLMCANAVAEAGRTLMRGFTTILVFVCGGVAAEIIADGALYGCHGRHRRLSPAQGESNNLQRKLSNLSQQILML
jgi:hypothetical protein